jgi:serine/threonine protein kinase
VGDLGLARSTESIKSSSVFSGTLQYIPPECWNKKEITSLSDIWFDYIFSCLANIKTLFISNQPKRSYGCVLYELIKLEKAFPEESFTGIMEAIFKTKIQLEPNNYFNFLLNK